MRVALRVLALATMLGAAVGGCAAIDPPPPPPLEPTPTPVPSLRVGITADAPPFAFRQAGRLTGIEIDLASYLGQDLGLSIRAFPMAWDELVPALVNRQIDVIMSGMAITRLRELQVRFSEPYLRSGLGVLVRRKEGERHKTPSKALAASDKVGVVKGTTAEKYVRETVEDAQVFSFTSNKNGVAELEQGRIDAFVSDAPVVAWYASLDEGALMPLLKPLLTKEEIGWGFRPTDEILREKADAALERWKRDGTLNGVLRRWLPTWERKD
jgi:polar amino acid transport system substrate-binding protein